MDLTTIIILVVVIALVTIITTMCVVAFKKEKQRQISYRRHEAHRAWAKKVSQAGSSRYEIAQIEAPPKSIGGEDSTFIYQLEVYEQAKETIRTALEKLAEIKLIKDPIEQRNRLLYHQELSPKDNAWVENRILEICRQQADALWVKAKGGDVDALSELITFTQQGRYGGGFYQYTRRRYAEPKGWSEVISEYFETPSLDLLRAEELDDGALLLLAQTAIRTKSIVQAKIVIAHWMMGKRYQLLIPQTMIETLVEMVEHYHATHPAMRRIEV